MPIRIPTVSVARIVKVYAQRLALRRTQKALARESISSLLKLPNCLLYLRKQGVQFESRQVIRRRKRSWRYEWQLISEERRLAASPRRAETGQAPFLQTKMERLRRR